MFKTIGIFAHVDAGKTTVAESLLYTTHQIKTQGRVDHQDSHLDHHDLERERGMTIFSDVARFLYRDTMMQLIDTPGHVDFASEMEQSISVLDMAIIVVSATDGVQSHTKTVFSLLQEAKKPLIFFVNKMDREEADFLRCVKEIQQLHPNAVYYDETACEELAALDESLMMHYFEVGYDLESWRPYLQKLVDTQQFLPILKGSGLKNEGIETLLRTIDDLCLPRVEREGECSGEVFSVRHEGKQPIAFVKLSSGKLCVKDEVLLHGAKEAEKVHQLRCYNGAQFEQAQQAVAGEIIAVVGWQNVEIGHTFGQIITPRQRKVLPTLKVSVKTKDVTPPIFLSYLHQLVRENPTLALEVSPQSGELSVRVLGVIAIEVLAEVFTRRFKITVAFGSPQIVYLETLENAVIGSGHYEPLKHYSEVHVRLEPLLRGSGIQFKSEVNVTTVPKYLQNLIQTHVFEKSHIGVLTGAVATDFCVTLVMAAYHERHTSGGDFREATYRAIRQGFAKAKTIVLEPMYDVRIIVELAQLGRVLTDIQCAHGRFEAPIVDETHATIQATVPVATFIDYPKTFASFAKGTGELSLQLGEYERCHNEADVIKASGYDVEADRENPCGSIFCAKGSGYVVAWQVADDYMHCEVKRDV